TYNDKNVINIVAFKDYCCIGFFKGALLSDPHQLLQKHGESSQAVRTLKFTDTKQILSIINHIKEYIAEAIDLEKAGARIVFKKDLEPVPEELEQVFNDLPVFKSAFYALTPGKQRAYIIYFSQPKQVPTRFSRIESCKEKIMNGEGLNDKYKC
ncbi:MAG: YdeI/OmpD-associated family protein, partial [Paludibacter sp.]